MNINKPMALLAAIFSGQMLLYRNWIRGSGTTSKRFRTPGKRQRGGYKLIRMAAEHRLDCTNLGGIVSESFRNMAKQKNQARLANE
jgi:hypothetical protein